MIKVIKYKLYDFKVTARWRYCDKRIKSHEFVEILVSMNKKSHLAGGFWQKYDLGYFELVKLVSVTYAKCHAFFAFAYDDVRLGYFLIFV